MRGVLVDLTASKLGFLAYDLLEKLNWITSGAARNLNKLQKIHPPLPCFDLPDKRVRTLEFRRKLPLGQSCLTSRADDCVNQLNVSPTA